MTDYVYIVCIEDSDGEIVEWYPHAYTSQLAARRAVETKTEGTIHWSGNKGLWYNHELTFHIYPFSLVDND